MPLSYSDLPPVAPPTPPTAPTADLGISGAATGIYDLIRAVQGKPIDESRVAAGAADPFSGQRGQYQQDLSTSINNPANSYMTKLTDLLTNPGSFKTDPGYQFALDQGLEGVSRHGNAMFGTTRSGNTAIELDKFGTGFAEQAFDTRVQQLLSGAGQEQTNYNQRIQSLLTASGANQGSPGTAGAILAGGYANQNANVAGGARGIDQLLRLLTGSGGSGGVPGGAAGLIKQIFGSGGSSVDLNNPDTGEYLRSIGIDPSQLNQNDINILTPPGASNVNLDLGSVSDSTGNLLDTLGPSIFDGGP